MLIIHCLLVAAFCLLTLTPIESSQGLQAGEYTNPIFNKDLDILLKAIESRNQNPDTSGTDAKSTAFSEKNNRIKSTDMHKEDEEATESTTQETATSSETQDGTRTDESTFNVTINSTISQPNDITIQPHHLSDQFNTIDTSIKILPSFVPLEKNSFISPFHWRLKALANDESGLVDVISRMHCKVQKESSEGLRFTTKESHEVILMNASFLVGYLTKDDNCSHQESLVAEYSKDTIERIDKRDGKDIHHLLSNTIASNVAKTFNLLSCDKKIPVVWVQLLENGNIVYTNQLKDTYRIYILDNGRLVDLATSKDKVEVYNVLSENTFLIMVSSFAINVVVSIASEFKGNDVETLYNFLWSQLEQKHVKEPELMIIKMRKVISNKTLFNLKPIEQTCSNKRTVNIQNAVFRKKVTGLEHVSPKLMTNTSTTRALGLPLNSMNPQLDAFNQPYPWSPMFFNKKNSGFFEIITSNMMYGKKKTTNTSLTFMTQGSLGIMITHVGLLVSYLVKLDPWKLPQTLIQTFSNQLNAEINKKQLVNTTTSLSKRLLNRCKYKIKKATCGQKIPVILVQLKRNDELVNVNQLQNLYQIYILDNGELVRLASVTGETEACKKSLGSKFIIMISSFAAEMVNVASGFNGHSTKELYDLIWKEIKKVYGETQKSELVIIKMKQTLKDRDCQSNLTDTKAKGKNRQIVGIDNKKLTKDHVLEHSPFQSIEDVSATKKQISTPTPLNPLHKKTIKNSLYKNTVKEQQPWSPTFFTKRDTGFVEIMISKMKYGILKETAKCLKFMTEKSHGFMATHVGVLVSDLIKLGRWELPEAFKETYSKESLEEMNDQNLITGICHTLSKRISKKAAKVFDNVSYNNAIPVLWIQFLENGDIVHINQLEHLYQIYILDNGNLVKLINDNDSFKIHQSSSENKFLIMISSFAADAVNIISGLDEDNTKNLHELVWNKIEQQYENKEDAELVIIKMKKECTCPKEKSRYMQLKIKKEETRSILESENFIKSFTLAQAAVFQIGDSIVQSQSHVQLQNRLPFIPLDHIHLLKTTSHQTLKILNPVRKLKLNPTIYYDKSYKFNNVNSVFTNILISKMSTKWKRDNTPGKVVFTANESHGITLTPFGLLVSYLVRKYDYKLPPNHHELVNTPGLIDAVNEKLVGNVFKQLSKKIFESKTFILKKFKALSLNNRLKTIWVQCIKGGGIAYANQRPDLYRTFLFGNGKLVELVGDCAAINGLPKMNNFIILISSPDVNAVRFVMDFKEDGTTEDLFNLIWNNVDRQRRQSSELIIMKMNNN